MTNQTETREQESATDAWRAALASRRTEVANPEAIPATAVNRREPDVSRRNFIRASFWGGLGLTLLGSVGLFLDYLWPRNVRGFGGPVPAGNISEFPKGGEPKHNAEGQFWLANLDGAETRPGGSNGADGLLALWRKCPHLGCTVPWRASGAYEGDRGGWYICPCHGSVYTKSGIRVFGPAPRSMDTMAITIDDAGNITVNTGDITDGGPDNPTRALQV